MDRDDLRPRARPRLPPPPRLPPQTPPQTPFPRTPQRRQKTPVIGKGNVEDDGCNVSESGFS